MTHTSNKQKQRYIEEGKRKAQAEMLKMLDDLKEKLHKKSRSLSYYRGNTEVVSDFYEWRDVFKEIDKLKSKLGGEEK